jgi:hypothetical protein
MKMLSVITMLLLVQACTTRPTQPVEGQNGATDRDRNNTSPAAGKDDSPSVPVVLDEQQLKNAYSFDTSNMRYKFSYLTTQSEGDLKFENGKARLDFKNLQEGVKGDLTLTLLEGTTAKLRGEKKDLILAKGQNNIELLMKSLQAGTGTTDILVNVELEQPTSGGSNPPPTPPTGGGTPPSNPPPTPPTGGGTPPVNPPNPPPTGGGDPNATSFARDIKPIFEAHCTECHHSGAQTPDLTSRGASEAAFEKIVSRIEGSSKPMPPAPRDKVTANELEKLRSWKTQGFRP